MVGKKGFIWIGLRISFWVMVICLLLGLMFWFGPESWGWSIIGAIIIGIIIYVLPFSIGVTFILAVISIYKQRDKKFAWISLLVSLIGFILAGVVYIIGWFLAQFLRP